MITQYKSYLINIMDDISKQRLSQINPTLAKKIADIIQVVENAGYKIRVVQGLRTFQEQADLFAIGRTKPGKIVTNAQAGVSWHNYGLAVDLVPGIEGIDSYSPDWEPKANGQLKVSWSTMLTEARKMGLVLGYDWHFQDTPHLQLSEIPTNPEHEDIQLVRKSGVKSVWKKYKV